MSQRLPRDAPPSASSGGRDPRPVRQSLASATFSRRRCGALSWTLVAAIIAARNPTPLLRPEFWAEDASEFFFGAVSMGASSLAAPVYGHQFFLSRLIAFVATYLPVAYAPHVYAWTSLAVNAACVSYVARDGFAWMLPRTWQRLLLAVAIAIGPGSADVFLNLSSLPYCLGLVALLLLIERPLRFGIRTWSTLLVLIVSSSQVALWVPMMLYVAWTMRPDRRASANCLVLAAVTVAVAAMNVHGNTIASASAGLAASTAPVWRILAENAFTRFAGPVVGPDVTVALMRSSGIVFWGCAAASAAIGVAFASHAFRRDPRWITTMLLGYACAIASLALVAMSRNYAIPRLLRETGTALWNVRYSFVPGAVALTCWASLLARLGASGRTRSMLHAALVASITCHLVMNWDDVRPRPDLDWPRKSSRVSELLSSRGNAGSHVVLTLSDLAVHPVGWVPDNGRTSVVLP